MTGGGEGKNEPASAAALESLSSAVPGWLFMTVRRVGILALE